MYGRRLVVLIGGWLGRATVLVAAVGLGAWWADGLLQASRRATDLLLTASDLRELAASADEQSGREAQEASDEANRAAEVQSSTSSDSEPADEYQVPPPAERLAVADDSQHSPNQGDTAPPVDQKAEPAVEEAVSSGEAEPVAASELADRVPEFGGEGTLQSFLGSAATSAEGTAPDGVPVRGPAWTIRFDRAYPAEDLGIVAGTRLAAVRPRRGGAECLPLNGRQLGPSQDVESWLREHPQHSARRGILLPRSWFRELDDRLLPLGGGWQFWLLIEDALFAQWIAQVSGRLAVRGTAWEQVERIEARLTLSSTGSEPQWLLDVMAIETNARGES